MELTVKVPLGIKRSHAEALEKLDEMIRKAGDPPVTVNGVFFYTENHFLLGVWSYGIAFGDKLLDKESARVYLGKFC